DVGVTVMPAASASSWLVTLTSAAAIPLYLASGLVTVVTIWYATSPSSRKSLTPVTVTVCGVFQLAGVNVMLAGTVPSLVSLDDRFTVTSATGLVCSTTLKVAVPPASVVTRPPVGLTLTAAVSLSWLVTTTFKPLTPLKAASALT